MGYRTADIGSFYGNRLDHRWDSSAGDLKKKSEVRKWQTGESGGLERALPKRDDIIVCFDRSPSGPFDGDKLSEGCRVHCVYRK